MIPQQVVAQLARAITNKLIHAPTTGLKKASAEGRHDVLGHAARLLGLPVDAIESVPVTRRGAAATRQPPNPTPPRAATAPEPRPAGPTLQ
jgi:glutamyl-tRNA reductase